MASAVKRAADKESVVTIRTTREEVRYCVLGVTPMICNRQSQKTKQELLFPKGPSTAAEKASKLKHDPMQEFRDSPYTLREDDAPTLIAAPSTAFKKAMMGAALDQPGTGARKTEIGRRAYVNDTYVPIYGTPEIFMAVARMADINRTPDIRTRAIIPRWAAIVKVTYTTPLVREPDITNLMVTAGQTQGIGDWRVEKGSGNYGQFELVAEDNPEFLEILNTGNRAAQIAAMAAPASYDSETDELLSWFEVEANRRGFKVA